MNNVNNSKDAIEMLGIISRDILNGREVNKYTANLYATLITDHLITGWGSYSKLKITLVTGKPDNYFEFAIPPITKDFISRFVNGHEDISGFLHQKPDINVKMSASLFKTMKSGEDGVTFFKNAVQYYDKEVLKLVEKLSVAVARINHEMKHLVGTTKLKGLVTVPLMSMFIFNNADMNNKKFFKVSNGHMNAITKLITNSTKTYLSSEEERNRVLNDVTDLVTNLNESVDKDMYVECHAMINELPTGLKELYEGAYNDFIEEANHKFINDNFEKMLCYESFFAKKLKKIPSDLIMYITIETEAIESPNDKMMIASYTMGKIEIVEWYIELLVAGSKKYVVPHTKPQLENIKNQLTNCLKKIMAVKTTALKNRPLLGSIKYPPGYEG